MTEAYRTSLESQLDLLRTGKISSLQLTELYVAHIRQHNRQLNIVVRDRFAQALKRAAQLDAALATSGAPVGPLHGLPFTIKDAFRIKGSATTLGVPGLQYLPAFDNCLLVERLIAAGGVLLGQTNVPLACFDWQTSSPIYGLTKNPLSPEHTVGGSSGGSAASLAAFFTPFEVGSDVAGSIRYPAHCCGVYGLRPTHDFVPYSESGPAVSRHSFANLAVAGPLARSIGDLQAVLGVLTASTDNSVTKPRLRIAYSLKWSGCDLDERSTRTIDAALSRIKDSGHELINLSPSLDFERCEALWGTILGYECKRLLPFPFWFQPIIGIFNYFFNTRRFKCGPFKDALQNGFFASKQQYLTALEMAIEQRAAFARMMAEFDLWLTPVSAAAALAHQKTGTPQILNSKTVPYSTYLGSYLMSTALLHHPILSAPLKAIDSCLPIGIQIHGKTGQDWQLLADSAQLSEIFRRP